MSSIRRLAVGLRLAARDKELMAGQLARIRRLAVGLCLATLVVGCGLTTSDGPEHLSRENLPEDLGGASDPTESGASFGEGISVRLYFITDDGDEGPVLTGILEEVPSSLTPGVVLEALFDYSRDELLRDGYRSAVPSGVALQGVSLDDGTGLVTVNLPEDFYEDPGEGEGRFAFGQVVLSISRLPAVEGVRFLQDDTEVPVTDGDGEIKEGPVTAADYETLLVD